MSKMNFLLIGIDTLRADHLSCYGYVRKTSPRIDELAREGIIFTRAYANGIPTHPSWTTILTGVHPLRHKVVTHMGNVKLSKSIPMIQEILRRQGYVTGAVDNMFLKYGSFYAWFTRGFDIYSHPGGVPAPEAGLKVQAKDVTEYSIKLISELIKMNKPFFAFLHYWDPHGPYKPPVPFNTLFWKNEAPQSDELLDYVISQYDGEIAYADSMIGKLLDFLEEQGLLDNTVVIITSDHGENLMQHGNYLGHKGLYDNITRVPLIIRFPEAKVRGKVDDLVQHVDIAPTILELAGVKVQVDMDGISLISLIEGKKLKRRDVVMLESTQQKAIGLRTEEWKLIKYLEKTPEGLPAGYLQLFNVSKDPSERVNLAYHELEVTEKLIKKLELFVREILHGEENPLLKQAITRRKVKFYSEAKDLIELYGLIIRYGQIREENSEV